MAPMSSKSCIWGPPGWVWRRGGFAAWVIGQFEATIAQVVALAVLMPIVASMGGIAGTQTLTLAVRGIALGQISCQNAPSLVAREVRVMAI